MIEDNETVVCFNGTRLQSIDDFFRNATTNDGRRLSSEVYHAYGIGAIR